MSVKCIALDMDRTTLNAQGMLSEENKKAIRLAIEKGVHVVIASGRAFSSLPGEVTEIPGIEYAVTCNGAEVYEISTGRCLKSSCLSPESVERILSLTEKGDVAYEGFIRGKAFAGEEYVKDPVRFGATRQAVDYVQRTRQMEPDIRAFLLSHKEELNSMDIIVKNEDVKEAVSALLEKEVPDIYITSSIVQLIEISSLHSGKHNGVRFIADQLGLSMEEVAAFGDADNDADMLKEAGVGIAVGNASGRAMEAADMVVPHHDRDGVAAGIYRLLGK